MADIQLRKLSPEDMDEFIRIAELPQVYEGTGRPMSSDKIFLALLVKESSFAITLEGKYIGYISMFRSKLCEWPTFLKSAEISYALNPNFWGRGYAGEALDFIIKKATEDNMDCILAGAFSDNERSRRMLESRGFRYIYSLDDSSREERIMLKVL